MRIVQIFSALLVLAACLSACAPRSIIRDKAQYQADIEQWADFAAEAVGALEAQYKAEAARSDVESCQDTASVYIFARYWAASEAEHQLLAGQIIDSATPAPTDVPTPDELCAAAGGGS